MRELYVENISGDVAVYDLAFLFNKFVKVKGVRLLNESMGLEACISMDDNEPNAGIAIRETNGMTLRGQRIKVFEVGPSPPE